MAACDPIVNRGCRGSAVEVSTDSDCRNHIKTPTTLIEMLEQGVSSRPAIRIPDGPTVTYGSLKRQVYALAGYLGTLGIGHGDRVAIMVPNGLEAIVSFLAVTATRATASPLNPAYKADESRFYLEDINAKALITLPEGSESAREAAPASTLLIDVTSDDSGEVRFSVPGYDGIPATDDRPEADDVALLLPTSGTTGRAKQVPLTHANLTVSIRNIVETYQLTHEDVSLCVMPLFHVHGLVASTLAALLSGGTVVMPSRFNALKFWSLVEANGVTWYSAVPAIHHVLLNRARSRANRGLDRGGYPQLRFIRSCSSPLYPDDLLGMEELFGAPVLEAYGMTEAAHQVASNSLPKDNRVLGSVGRGTGVSIAIMDENGVIQPTGTRGEVVIQGPSVTQGYVNNPEANISSFTNGWFRTGDEGIIDPEGNLTLVGRLKELINRSGEKVSPCEIDEVLMAHPAVAEAVAFGVPDSVHGEEPSAAVVLREQVSQSDLVAHCRTHLAEFKCPKVIHIVEAIPLTATGKIQRCLVAETVAGESGKPSRVKVSV